MIYRTYKYEEMSTPIQWTFTEEDGVNRRIFYNYDTLKYASSGPVASWNLDEDYLVNNNSTVNIVRPTEAEAGQIIAIIDEYGGYDLGVVNTVDNEKLQITFKQMTSLFDIDVLNPARVKELDEDGKAIEYDDVKYLYDAVNDTARILGSYFCQENTDRYMRLPMRVTGTTGGGFRVETNDDGTETVTDEYNVKGIWSYDDDTVNLLDWLEDLFENYNVVLRFDLTFTTDGAYIALQIVHNTVGGRLIKANVKGLEVTHNEDTSASSTVCAVLHSESREQLSTWYLLRDNTVVKSDDADYLKWLAWVNDGEDPETKPAKTFTDRVVPYALTAEELQPADDETDDDGTVISEGGITLGTDGLYHGKDDATDKDVAESALLYSDFNHYVSLEIFNDSDMYPRGLTIGDNVRLVLSLDGDDGLIPTGTYPEGEWPDNDYSEQILDSVYTGRKADSSSSEETLIFGKIRINYTDLIQIRTMKKVRS